MVNNDDNLPFVAGIVSLLNEKEPEVKVMFCCICLEHFHPIVTLSCKLCSHRPRLSHVILYLLLI
jgi:hypothetical protein